MAKRKRSSKRTSVAHGGAAATTVAEPRAPQTPRPVSPRPRHLARVDQPHPASGRAAMAGLLIQAKPARWTDRPKDDTKRDQAAGASPSPLRPRSPWQVHGAADLFAFFGPLLSAIVACQALVVVLLGQQLSDPSWLALLALFLGMLFLDHLAIHPLIGRHHRKFLPRLFTLLGASALPALALIVIRRLS